MNNKVRKYLLCGAMILVAGCTQSRLAMDYGTSFQLQKYNQLLNPDAEKNLKPVYGLNAKAAQKSEEKYQKGFEAPGPAITSYQLNLGTIGK